jgi:hypothetical protein
MFKGSRSDLKDARLAITAGRPYSATSMESASFDTAQDARLLRIPLMVSFVELCDLLRLAVNPYFRVTSNLEPGTLNDSCIFSHPIRRFFHHKVEHVLVRLPGAFRHVKGMIAAFDDE